MATEPATEATAVDPAASAHPPSSKKKLIIIVASILLLAGIGGGLMASGILSKKPAPTEDGAAEGGDEAAGGHGGETAKDGAKKGEKASAGEGGTFYQMPDMIVNLTGDSGKQRFLKISITLELNSKSDSKAIEAVLPRVTDHFQTYLRELRLDDLRGSAGLYRLRQELLDRVHSASGIEVKDVLFEEILVQ